MIDTFSICHTEPDVAHKRYGLSAQVKPEHACIANPIYTLFLSRIPVL